MRRLSLLVALLAAVTFMVSTAYADVEVCGQLTVNSITLYESDAADVPVQACDLVVSFLIRDAFGEQGPYIVPVTAFGTQLNIALKEAYLVPVPVDACLRVTTDLGTVTGIQVTHVTFPATP